MYRLNKCDIEKYLLPYQKEILDVTLSLSEVSIQENSEEINAQLLLYPVRLILNEKDFNTLSLLTGNVTERTLKLVCLDDQVRKAAGIIFYRTSFSEEENFLLQDNTFIMKEHVKMHDLLIIAGFLSSIPGSKFSSPVDITINNNFNELSFSLRRYFIESIVLAKKPTIGFFFLDEMDALKDILPEVAAGKNLSQNKFHKYDIFEHLIRSCEAMEVPDLVLRFSALLHDIGKVPTRKVKENGEATFYNHEIVSSYMLVSIMKRFGIPKAIGMKVKYYVRNHMFHYTDEWSDKAVRRFLRKVSRPDLQNLILLRKSDRLGSGKTNPYPRKLQSLIDHIDDVIMRDLELKVTDLEINGKDLMSMGLSQGPELGRILHLLLNEVKDEITRNNHEELVIRARALIAKSEAENIARLSI